VSDFVGDGIHLGAAAIIEDVDVVNVGGACIIAGEQSRVQRSRVGAGGLGITVGPSSIIDSCTSIGNTAASPYAGILMGSYGTISNSISSYNAGDGISVANGDGVTNCLVANNTGAGIVAAAGSKVNECTSRSNKGTGISLGTGSTVKRCTVTDSGNDGIRAVNNCVILENNVVGNYLNANNVGIHLTGTSNGAANRLESNQVSLANPGIQVDSSGNLLIRNTVAGGLVVTSPYRIANNNVLRVVNTSASGAFDGASGGNGLNSTDPWANFTD
jgi:parallel beta-helix repeat protein